MTYLNTAQISQGLVSPPNALVESVAANPNVTIALSV
jgi:hypothetical protein